MEEQKLSLCREIAAQTWCQPKTSNIIFDPILCEEFAKILYSQIYEECTLGTHTTREILTELTCRIEVLGELDYKTVGEI
jgi:hypothetical protein